MANNQWRSVVLAIAVLLAVAALWTADDYLMPGLFGVGWRQAEPAAGPPRHRPLEGFAAASAAAAAAGDADAFKPAPMPARPSALDGLSPAAFISAPLQPPRPPPDRRLSGHAMPSQAMSMRIDWRNREDLMLACERSRRVAEEDVVACPTL